MAGIIARSGKPVYVTFYPRLRNHELTKDIGMIPEFMARNFGYDGYIVGYKNEEFENEKELTAAKVVVVRQHPILARAVRFLSHFGKAGGVAKIALRLLDSVVFIVGNARSIDVLQQYQVHPKSALISILYKLINPNGVSYVFLDFSPGRIAVYKSGKSDGICDFLGTKKCVSDMRRYFAIGGFDFASCELMYSFDFLKNEGGFGDRLVYVPFGVDAGMMAPFRKQWNGKENLVMHVGWLGNRAKATETLLCAFADVARKKSKWNMLVVGPVESGFEGYIESFFAKNPDMKKRITLAGKITDMAKLYSFYAKSKIFLFPSRFESFGVSAIEAGVMENAVVCSGIPALREITGNGAGSEFCAVDDVECFSEKLGLLMGDPKLLEKKAAAMAAFVETNYDWAEISKKINSFVEKAKNRERTG